MDPFAIRASVRPSRFCAGFVVMSTASCLLTTPLGGLVGPPLSTDDGGITDGGVHGDGGEADIADTNVADAEAGVGNTDAGFDGAGPVQDAPIADGDDGDVKRPIRVARVNGVLRGIAEHGEYVYWAQTDVFAGIARVPKEPNEAGMSPFFINTPNAFDVGVDDEFVYWSTGTSNEVYRKAIQADGSSAELFWGADEAFYLAVGAAGHFYVTGRESVAVGPRPDAGYTDLHYRLQFGAAGIATHGAYLFWSRDICIFRGTDQGQAKDKEQLIYSGMPGDVAGVATDGVELYFVGPNGIVRAIVLDDPLAPPREVCRGSAETNDAESDARVDGDAGTLPGADIAVDEQWVYFTEPAIQQISKCRKR
jgi:hypothetical protein